MRIEDAIKQSKGFKSECHKLLINIQYRSNVLTNRIQAVFKEDGITLQQYNVLRILRGQYPEAVSINLIKERMLDQNSDVSRLITRLQTKKLIERKVCPGDRRQMNIRISDSGLELLNALDTKVDKINNCIKGITEEEAKTLNDLLDKIQ